MTTTASSPHPAAPLAVGSQAPDFTLKSARGAGANLTLVDVTLRENLGVAHTVLLFFPLAFTGVCTQEMCDLTGGLADYEKLNARVIAVSVDSPFAQAAWAQKERIALTLASDLNKTTAAAYGVLLPDLNGLGSVAARAAFVIDKTGIVRYAEQTPTPKHLPSFDGIRSTLATL